MSAYYNEFDPKAAAWLRELIAQDHIAPGEVDERSIADVRPDDLRGFRQCHFFAGIAVWSYALRRAGVPDDTSLWTGSAPCQPFSAAGKGDGVDDERHLWPHFHHLIDECRPDLVLGEQVASKDGLGWFDLVQADLEGSGYAAGAVDLCAAGVGAPHIRQRLWWVGERLDNPAGARRFGAVGGPEGIARDEARLRLLGARGRVGGLENPLHSERGSFDVHGQDGRDGPDGGRQEAHGLAGARSEVRSMEHATRDGRIKRGAEPSWRGAASGRGLGGLGNPDGPRGAVGLPEQVERQGRDATVADDRSGGLPRLYPGQPELGGLADAGSEGRREVARGASGDEATHGREGRNGVEPHGDHVASGHGADGRPGPTNGFWRDADWLHCRDGKWRPVESGTFPLAHGAAARVGRLRGYGNAIVAPAAQAFIEAYLESRRERFRLMSALTDDEDIFA